MFIFFTSQTKRKKYIDKENVKAWKKIKNFSEVKIVWFDERLI